MIKWYHLLITLALGIGIGYFWPHGVQTEDVIIKPQIDKHLKAVKERSPSETKLKDSLKIEIKDKKDISKENREKRVIADKSIQRVKEVKDAIPLTHKDTIDFLKRDTAALDTALLRLKQLAQGLTKEIVKDEGIIKTITDLNIKLEADNKDLQQADSLHQIKEKQLAKKGRKKFFRVLGVGGAIGAFLVLLL